MFERFTDRARRAVVLAQEEARLLNHNYIGTEHLLLGLLSERDGVACEALESLGITLDAARQEVEEVIGAGSTLQKAHVPFTPRAKKVLEMALREAMQLRCDFIGTEHILLGLVREGEGVAAQVLVKRGAGLNEVRARVMELVARRGPAAEVAAEMLSGPAPMSRAQRAVVTPPSHGRVVSLPELVRVIPIGRQVELHEGLRLVLLSLEVWSAWLDLRLALVSSGDAIASMPAYEAGSMASYEGWALADDRGTAYQVAGASSSGDRLMRVHQVSFSPSPPAEAKTLTLKLPGAGEGGTGEEIVVVVELA